jgi:bifunctional non-homologous end joining protein LigD
VRRLEPEEAVACSAPFDGDDWRFGVDWDGMRVILTTTSEGDVRIHDERLQDVTPRLAEITGAAVMATGRRAAVLDGVVARLDREGCPDLAALFDALAERPGRITTPGLVFLAIDLLHLDSASLLAWPFDRRRSALREALTPTPHVQLPELVEGQGRAVAEAAAARGLCAVLARHSAAPYRPGVASPQRLRITLGHRTDTVVVGAVMTPGRRGEVTALLLAEWEEGRLVEAGRAAVATDSPLQRWLGQRVAGLRTATLALDSVAAAEAGAGLTWLQPSLVATVRHHGRGSDGRLRLPVPVAVREDRALRWCIRRDPVPPPALAVHSRSDFRPTVITRLPLGD